MDKQRTDRLWWPLFALALAITAIPILLTPMPPLLDYPNHYVRLWLLEGGADLQPLARMYRIDWHGAYTNIFIDLVAAAARGIVPVTIVGPALLVLALLLPGIGIAALAGPVHGRLGWWHGLCVILGWSQVFLLGFVNFQIALGIALLGAAAQARLGARPWWLRMALSLGVGVAVLVAHPFGLLLYAMLVGGLAMGPAPFTGSWRGARRAIGRAIVACLPLVVLVVWFWLVAPHPGDHQAGPAAPIQWQTSWILGKPAILLSPFKSYRSSADLLFVAAFAVPVAIALVLRRLRWHGGLLVAAAVLAAGSFAMPAHYLGTAFLELRLPAMLWLTLAAALLPEVGGTSLLVLALAVVAARAEGIGRIWLDRQKDLAAVERVLAHVPPGAAILPLVQAPERDDAGSLPPGRAVGKQLDFWHLPTLAILHRHAFVPTLFSNPGKQVVQVRPPYLAISVREGAIATIDKLGTRLNAVDAHEFPYLDRWPCFDYVLVINADVPNAAGPLRPIPQLALVEDAGFARLYAVTPDAGARCTVPGLDRGSAAGRSPVSLRDSAPAQGRRAAG